MTSSSDVCSCFVVNFSQIVFLTKVQAKSIKNFMEPINSNDI